MIRQPLILAQAHGMRIILREDILDAKSLQTILAVAVAVAVAVDGDPGPNTI